MVHHPLLVVVVYLTARYALRSTKYVLSLRHGPLNMGRVILNMVIRSHLSRMRNGVKYARTNTSNIIWLPKGRCIQFQVNQVSLGQDIQQNPILFVFQ